MNKSINKKLPRISRVDLFGFLHFAMNVVSLYSFLVLTPYLLRTRSVLESNITFVVLVLLFRIKKINTGDHAG